jgi:Bacterial PH domain
VDEVSELNPRGSTRVRFGPDLRLSALIFVAAMGALVLAVMTGDAPGRLIFGLAALVLAAYAVGDVIFWPRLVADQAGLRIRTPMTRADVAWADVEGVDADVRSRYGLRSTTLEIDAGPTLVVFSRRALGADPETVQNLVRALDPRGSPGRA